jgi:CheY-like chemotaxis protein
MKVLVAEDEHSIAKLYKITLESKGHEVLTTYDGRQCVEIYEDELKKVNGKSKNHSTTPFDAVILDYRMPLMDGMEAAKCILAVQPQQRIIFASAYVVDTLAESIKDLGQIVELIQKPFELDSFVNLLEDADIYSELQKLNVKIKDVKDMNPTHAQIKDLLEGLRKIQKGRML